MKRILYILIFILFISEGIWAQEILKPELPPIDSSFIEDSLFIPSGNLTNPLFEFSDFRLNTELTPIKLPEFDFYETLFNFRQDYSYYIFNPEGNTNLNIPFAAMPFTHSATIFSQAAYKISDKITIGGNSYGANSIFSSPLPNNGNNFDVKGASMFFEYKVSDKFRIQTRVNVNNRQF